MISNTSASPAARLTTALLSTALLSVLLSSAAAAQVTVSGVIDATTNSGSAVLTSTSRGFSLIKGMTINENFIRLGINGCNADPARCVPGASLGLDVVMGDFGYSFTVDGVEYRGGCFTCNAAAGFQISGSIVLPPNAPTATATGRFTLTGWARPGDGTQVDYTGAGTATLYLHSPGSAGYPNSWWVDRVVLRLDGPLPEPWTNVDVGKVGLEGNTWGTVPNDGSSSFTVAGAGADIWGTSDAFQFAVAVPSGNRIVARVDSETATNPYAKAGVMLRNGFGPGDSTALLDVKPDGGIEFMARTSDGGSMTFIAGAAATFPVWLKMTQTDQITASISTDGQTWQDVGSVPNFFAPYKGLAVTSHDPSLLNEARFSQVDVADAPDEPLPGGWLQADVGATAAQGSATITGSQIAVSGDGADIWGSADAFHYVYQSLRFDGDIVARVTSLQNTNPYAKAGVMLRSGLGANAQHVVLDVKPDGGIEFMSRMTTGTSTTYLTGTFQAMPVWLRLSRRSNVVTGSVSADGVNWTVLGSVGFAQSSLTLAGLAVTSHVPGVLTTATFDSVAVNVLTGVPVPWNDLDLGTTGLAGKAYWDNGTFTVQGAGADIWGSADSFNWVLQQAAKDPVSLSARVVSETDTNPYAKAGIMLRNSYNSPGNAFVLIDVKPNGEIEVLQRAADGGDATWVAGVTVGFPVYLRLQRSGSSVVASYSSDGSNWTTVATVPITWSGAPYPYIGLVVTSHDTTQLNTAVFDNVVGP